MTNDIAGLNFDPSRPGFEHVFIKPNFISDLDWAEANYQSVKGNISVKWERIGNNTVILSATLPAGISATVFPGSPDEKTIKGSQSILINL